MQQPSVRGSGHLPFAEALLEDLTGISGCRRMYWGNHVRILFTVTLVWQAVPLGKGREKEENVKSLNATAQKHQPKNEGTFINALNDMNQSYESRKQQSPRSLVPFTGITESKKLSRHCCQNGGTCILGSFCACLKHFTGRYCEHDERQSNCGSIAHGAWVLKGCWLCRCGYGTLNCLSEIMHDNCGAKDIMGLPKLSKSSLMLTVLELKLKKTIKGVNEESFEQCLSSFHVNEELKSEKEEITRLYSTGLRLQQTVFAVACLLTILLEFCCWQL